jgi:sister-chromatid-cohesion protein PDS5
MRGRYIEFFVNLVATADNISLLYYIASRAKTVQDAEGGAFSDVRMTTERACALLMPWHQRLYVASELAQAILKAKAKAKSWTIQSYPGKVKLPGDILRPLANAETQNKVRSLPSRLLLSAVPDDVAARSSKRRTCPIRC